jgi:hypothetical protein
MQDKLNQKEKSFLTKETISTDFIHSTDSSVHHSVVVNNLNFSKKKIIIQKKNDQIIKINFSIALNK